MKYAFRTPEDTMTATTDHYLGIDVHKRQVQIAVLGDEGVEEIRVARRGRAVAPYNLRDPSNPKEIEYRAEHPIEKHGEDIT
ncbi:hypothetical protein [Natrialba sp. INN-245]|uniref:hypothetical protein n=1 Tax=Natrialba sp. INN-245 TaxID=2690967 RepID=UPI0013120940|nr:hypothetical protein [Natrialba sp. INN-245]MWV41117.1 hypothetical protein [Natrialba sp. INN-245]